MRGGGGGGQVAMKPSAVAPTCVNSPGAGHSSPPAGPAAWSHHGGPGTGPGSWREASSASTATAPRQTQHSKPVFAASTAAWA